MIRLNNKAFTITELAIAAVVAGIVSVAVISVVITFYGGILRGDIESRMVVDSQIILRNIVDELRVGANIRDTNLVPDSYEPTGGWSTSSDNAILIISTPVLEDDGEFAINDSIGLPHYNEIIYFADGGTMYRRVLANPIPSENNLRTTCPAEASSPSCPADSILTEEYDVMNFVLYDQDDAVTTDLDAARSVEMNINLLDAVFGEEVRIDNNIRVTLRN